MAQSGHGGDDGKHKHQSIIVMTEWWLCVCVCVIGMGWGPVRRRWRDALHWWTERWMVYNERRHKHWINNWSTVLQPPKDSKQDRKGLEDRQQQLGVRTETASSISNMRALVVLPLLLWAMVCVVQVRAEMKAVKLCGREFLRAVVYTCGGSRWRRFLTESDIDGESKYSSSSLFPGVTVLNQCFLL